MHQLLCAVDEEVFVDGYCVRILEVTAETVRIGLSVRGTQRSVHEIRIPSAQQSASTPRPLVMGPGPSAG